MDIKDLQHNWEEFGRRDPMWAILTDPGKEGGRWDEDEFYAQGRALIPYVIQQVKALGLPRQMGSALDFGCGLGRLTQALCPHFERVTGVDIAASMIEGARARNRFGAKCSYLHNPHPHLAAIADESVDFVITLLVLQHMRPELALGYIGEFVRILRPGGAAVFQVPCSDRPPRTVGADRGPDDPFMEMYSVPQADVAAIITGRGARIVAQQADDGARHGWPGFVYVATKD